jgi:DNA-binding CsgD family transcriptional regulator
VGDAQAMLRLLQPLDSPGGAAAGDAVEGKRRLLADVCRLIGDEVAGRRPPRDKAPERLRLLAAAIRLEKLSPRMQQTLLSLLGGDSEKQVAAKLGVSPHTVHVYVKQLYRKYGVSSRGELLARWVTK